MDNTRTIIRSSIASILIVTVGLFMLCISRAPKINTDESIFGNGETVESDEQSLLSLLADAGEDIDLYNLDEIDSESNTRQSESRQSESNEDDLLATLLNEGEESFNSSQYTEEGDAGMDELLSLLQTDEQSEQTPQDLLQLTESAKQYSAVESNKIGAAAQSSALGSAGADLGEEVSYLENVLVEKKSEKQNLESQIRDYDQRIAELEAKINSRSGQNFQMRQTSYSEATPQTLDRRQPEFSGGTFSRSIDDFEISYQDALRLFHQRRYHDARKHFYQLLQINPKHSLADNCQYWIGECWFAQGNYYQAIVEFNKVAAYDAPGKKDDAQLMLGLAFIKLGEKRSAQSELNWFINSFASSEYINKAFYYLNRL
ncbi:MAG: tetratricopeptide repeat protein [bacterium]|nr:tetratricopeptide repeat protein [bacterium]